MARTQSCTADDMYTYIRLAEKLYHKNNFAKLTPLIGI